MGIEAAIVKDPAETMATWTIDAYNWETMWRLISKIPTQGPIWHKCLQVSPDNMDTLPLDIDFNADAGFVDGARRQAAKESSLN